MSRPRGQNKDLRALLRTLERAGATAELTGSGHWKVHYDGRLVATLGSTPSRSAMKLALHNLRAAGLPV